MPIDPSLRKKETDEKYEEWKKDRALDSPCVLCEKEPLKLFTHWKLIENDFPYDLITEVHHMIAPLRHINEHELNEEEQKEFKEIKDTFIHKEYQYILEATYRGRSIPDHFHPHLIITKQLPK